MYYAYCLCILPLMLIWSSFSVVVSGTVFCVGYCRLCSAYCTCSTLLWWSKSGIVPHVWCIITEIVEAQERSTAFWEYYCGGPGVAYHVFNVLLGDPGVVCGYCEDPGWSTTCGKLWQGMIEVIISLSITLSIMYLVWCVVLYGDWLGLHMVLSWTLNSV